MPQSLSKVLLHIIFSTKGRQKWLTPEIQHNVHAYLASTCKALDSHAFLVGGTADHVHIACTLPRTVSLALLVAEIKKSSSKWLKEQPKISKNFAWQNGYGAFSISWSQLESLMQYIEKQEEHHRKHSFKEEFLQLLERYKIEYNLNYLWE